MPKRGVRFGDYLRAIITADYDLFPVDDRRYRVVFLEAFRRSGIFPAEVGTLSVDTLLWPQPEPDSPLAHLLEKPILEMPRDVPEGREAQHRRMRERCDKIEDDLRSDAGKMNLLQGVDPGSKFVHSIWPRAYVGSKGEWRPQWVVEIAPQNAPPHATYTFLVDADTGLVRYAINKPTMPKAARETRQDLLARFNTVRLPQPVQRHLRVFAFDPSLAQQMETARINQVTLDLPYEKVDEGPVGEYLEVVDYDPITDCFYDPIDLNDKYLIAQDGCDPSQSNPQFHQQMVYAVATRTIRNFERALGQLALWSPHWESAAPGNDKRKDPEQFVRRLRLYPHALREANAFYSPEKKAVLFGYFQSTVESRTTPVTVFTCLSHDIIAHELTHALLDGMHRRLAEPSNPDSLALHEAFADIVALFQHFSLPEVLENQIATTRGDLASQNRLGELAQEFGRAIGSRGALRSAIGEVDEATGEWRPRTPDPQAYVKEMEPHKRGSLLVAAVFDAFLTIYRSRVADLFRIATKGTGVLPAGNLHPDLVRRLAAEAAASAQGVLEMCIRALNYTPPSEVTFGDYLRAIITADYEFDPIDEQNRRVAFIEAFRRHGILPEGVRTFSQEGLLWPQMKAMRGQEEEVVVGFIRDWTKEAAIGASRAIGKHCSSGCRSGPCWRSS